MPSRTLLQERQSVSTDILLAVCNPKLPKSKVITGKVDLFQLNCAEIQIFILASMSCKTIKITYLTNTFDNWLMTD